MKNIGKEVFSENGKMIGYVLDVAVDFQSLTQKGYVVVSEEGETEFVLENADIKKVLDFVLIEDETCLKYQEEKNESLIGKVVIDENGQDYGTVREVLFEKRKCKKLITQKCEIPSRFVKTVGDDAIFVSFHRAKEKKAQTKTKEEDFESSKKQSVTRIVAPEKISLAFNFYSGKIAKMDVFGYNNERIVSKGEPISRGVFENVKKHNKLNELFFAIY